MTKNYRWDDFELDLDGFRLTRGGEPVSLEPKAFNLLAMLVERPGHLFSKQEIFERIWPNIAVTDHALTRVVAQLRRALGDEAREARYIETVPTRGYRWIRDVEPVHPAHLAETPAPPPPAAPSARRAVFPGLAAALTVTAAVLALALGIQRDVPTSATASADKVAPSLWPVQVTTYNGLELQPSISPQGDALAFVSDRSGGFEIYVRTLGGTPADIALTSDGGQNTQPAWSPDGRFIAYHSYVRGGIWMIPARGGVAQQVSPTGSHPAWSPDGRRLAFQTDEANDVTPSAYGAQAGSTIWIINADGSGARAVTRTGHPIGGHAVPSWSTNGRSLIFSVFEAGDQSGVWRLDLDAGEVRPLALGHGLFEAVFAPHDRALYVAGGQPVIVRIPFDPDRGVTTGPRELLPVAGVAGVRGLSMSHDGARLAFSGLTLSSQIWAQALDRRGGPAGAPYALTDDNSRRISLPAISPDGARFTYMSSRAGERPNIWMADIDGGNAVQLTADETGESKPHWSPDGRRLVYHSDRTRGLSLWSIDVSTRREESLFSWSDETRAQMARQMPGRLAEFTLSRALTQAAVVMLAPPTGQRALHLVDLDTLAPRRLGDPSLSIGYPAWSRDDRRLAVEVKIGSSVQAGVIDLEAGTLRMLTEARGQSWVRSWAPDNRRIAFAAMRDGVWSLRWIDADTGEEGILSPEAPPRIYMRYPEWSPRGDVIIYERGELKGNIWMLPVK